MFNSLQKMLNSLQKVRNLLQKMLNLISAMCSSLPVTTDPECLFQFSVGYAPLITQSEESPRGR